MMAARSNATFHRSRRLIFASGLVGAVVAIPAAANLFGGNPEAAPLPVADNCEVVAPNGIVIPVCGPGLYGGSVSAGAPSQGLITLKNWCNLVIGGCSAAFYYPQGPVRAPETDTTVWHHRNRAR